LSPSRRSAGKKKKKGAGREKGKMNLKTQFMITVPRQPQGTAEGKKSSGRRPTKAERKRRRFGGEAQRTEHWLRYLMKISLSTSDIIPIIGRRFFY